MYENQNPVIRRRRRRSRGIRYGIVPVVIIALLVLFAGSILLTPGEDAEDQIIGVVSEPDTAAPTITGVKDTPVYAGDMISYRSGVAVAKRELYE